MIICQRYGILQRGYVTLEAKYKRRHEDLVKLQEELCLQGEEHTKHTNELTEQLRAKGEHTAEGEHGVHVDKLTQQLKTKEEELEKLRGEIKGLAHTSQAVKDIVDQVRSTDVYRFLSAVIPFDPSRFWLSLLPNSRAQSV